MLGYKGEMQIDELTLSDLPKGGNMPSRLFFLTFVLIAVVLAAGSAGAASRTVLAELFTSTA
jgi:hypothetical protein